MPAITPTITPAAPLKKPAPARVTYAEKTERKIELLADTYKKGETKAPSAAPKFDSAAALEKLKSGRLSYAEQNKLKAELLADAYNKSVAANPNQPKRELGMGDHAFWANPASYWRMADADFWRNPNSYR